MITVTTKPTSRALRWLVGGIVAIMAVWIVGPNMPGGPAHDLLDGVWKPATNAGLDQDWGVFSPNPRDQSIDVRAIIDYADGSSDVWDVPRGGAVLGAYREYRWQKWQERVRLDSRRDLWAPTASWIADQHRRDGELPAKVTLVRRWRDVQQLTSNGAAESNWKRYAFYEWTPAT